MQKSIWSATSEVLKYNSIRPEHPAQIVDNVIQFLKLKYKVEMNLFFKIQPKQYILHFSKLLASFSALVSGYFQHH